MYIYISIYILIDILINILIVYWLFIYWLSRCLFYSFGLSSNSYFCVLLFWCGSLRNIIGLCLCLCLGSWHHTSIITLTCFLINLLHLFLQFILLHFQLHHHHLLLLLVLLLLLILHLILLLLLLFFACVHTFLLQFP